MNQLELTQRDAVQPIMVIDGEYPLCERLPKGVNPDLINAPRPERELTKREFVIKHLTEEERDRIQMLLAQGKDVIGQAEKELAESKTYRNEARNLLRFTLEILKNPDLEERAAQQVWRSTPRRKKPRRRRMRVGNR